MDAHLRAHELQPAFYPKWDTDYALQLREMFELDPQQRIRKLSRGQRARAGLLITLAHRPDVLLLDEPSSGLDPIVRRDILSAIIRTVSDEGRTVVFSSHLLDEVERVVDWVAMIHKGRKVLCDSIDEVLKEHRSITVRFDEATSSPPELPGALASRGEGREWTFVCNGEHEQLAAVVQQSQASTSERLP